MNHLQQRIANVFTENLLVVWFFVWQYEVDAISFKIVALVWQAKRWQVFQVQLDCVFFRIREIRNPAFLVVESARKPDQRDVQWLSLVLLTR